MAQELNISGIIVLKLDRKDKVSDLVEASLAQNASTVSELAAITHDDTAMHLLGTTLQSTYVNYKKSPPTATKADVTTAANNLVDAYSENAAEIQSIARKESKSAGDVNVGINIALKAGYRLKDPKSAMQITFEVVPDGSGAVKIKTKAVAKHAVYIREYGKASAKNVEPLKANIEEWLISTENDVRLCDLDVGSWYAFREASVIPISRKSDSGTPTTNVEKSATPILVTKAHRRTFYAGGVPNYNFSGWIWVLIN